MRSKLEEFRSRAHDNLAVDHAGALVYLAPTRVNLQLTLERWPDITLPRDARARGLSVPGAGRRETASRATARSNDAQLAPFAGRGPKRNAA